MPDINYKKNLHDELTELIDNFVEGLSEEDFKVLKKHIFHNSRGFRFANYDLRIAANRRREREEN